MTPKWHSATISLQIRRDTVNNSILELHIEHRIAILIKCSEMS